MKKIISALLVGVTLVGASVSASTEASARARRSGDPAAAAAFGLFGGLLLGGIIASNQRPRHYYAPSYDDRYNYNAPRHYAPRYVTPQTTKHCEQRIFGYDRSGNPQYHTYCDGG